MTISEAKNILEYVREKIKGVDVGLGSEESYRPSFLPFGIAPLDNLLGQGLPFGRLCLFKGPYSTGKTYLAQLAIVAAQRKGLLAAYIDAERGYDPAWFAKSGVDTKKLLLSQPESGEQAFDVMEALIESGVQLVVLDSIPALVPSSDITKSFEKDAQVAELASLVGRGLRRVNRINKNKSVVILINYPTSGIMAGMRFPTSNLIGGKRQWQLSSIVLDIHRTDYIYGDNKEKIGFIMQVTTEKNKLSAPQKTIKLSFMYEGGELDFVRATVEMALSLGFIKQAGAFYSLNGEKIRGKLNVLDFLKKSPDALKALEAKVADADQRSIVSKESAE